MTWNIEKPENDMNTILSYAPGTLEREQLLKELENIKNKTEEIPLIINGREVKTDEIMDVKAPHDHNLVLAKAHLATDNELREAVDASLEAHEKWAGLEASKRAEIFQKAAELLAKSKRIRNIATIMMNLSKVPYEAEIDLAEMVDFWNFNAYHMKFIYDQQPDQYTGEINSFDWRPLEGYVLAISPFNFYSIAGNLPSAPAMLGNVVVWKPSRSVIFSNYEIMKLLIEAGLPKGVINFVPFSSKYSDTVLKNENLAGLHFTGSYETLVKIWGTINKNLDAYKNFPRVTGEAGGKDFIFAHSSADPVEVSVNIIRGAFEYQGQKCSAASRAYIPESLWKPVKEYLLKELPNVKYGAVDDLNNLLASMINEAAFDKAVSYLDYAKQHPEGYEFIYGGEHDSSTGWFIEPTIIKTTNPNGKLITEEIFAPIMTVYIYKDDSFEETLKLCDRSTKFALTGSIFSKDKNAAEKAQKILRYSAGNFYINDKPTGAIVSRQPFGGARNSGTNDKAGSWINLLRWLSPRTIKETPTPAKDWKRAYLS